MCRLKVMLHLVFISLNPTQYLVILFNRIWYDKIWRNRICLISFHFISLITQHEQRWSRFFRNRRNDGQKVPKILCGSWTAHSTLTQNRRVRSLSQFLLFYLFLFSIFFICAFWRSFSSDSCHFALEILCGLRVYLMCVFVCLCRVCGWICIPWQRLWW